MAKLRLTPEEVKEIMEAIETVIKNRLKKRMSQSTLDKLLAFVRIILATLVRVEK